LEAARRSVRRPRARRAAPAHRLLPDDRRVLELGRRGDRSRTRGLAGLAGLTMGNRLEQTVEVTLGSGRHTIGFAEWGDPTGLPLLIHHGTPASRLGFDCFDDAARDRGVRAIAIDRPGMGLSDREHDGFTVASWSRDIGAIADGLELERFTTLGW